MPSPAAAPALTHPATGEPGLLTEASRAIVPLRGAFSRLIATVLELRPTNAGAEGGADGRERDGRFPVLPGVDATLQSRLNRALQTENDLASLYHLPGPSGLRRVIKGAQKAGFRERIPELLDECGRCVAQYEQFLKTEDITREQLHAVLGGFLAEARMSMVRANCQANFKSMSNIVGYYTEASVGCAMYWPGSLEHRVNCAGVHGCYGFRRLRRDAWHVCNHFVLVPEDWPEEARITSLDGTDLSELRTAPLVEPFCRNAAMVDISDRAGLVRQYRLEGNEIGVRSLCDFFLGQVYWNGGERYRTDSNTSCFTFSTISTPSKYFIRDVLIHQELWPQVVPSLDCYRVVPDGRVTEANWAHRQHDRLDLGLALHRHEPGLPNLESTMTPNYHKLISHAFDQLGLRMNDFIGFRFATPYPLYGVQYTMRFNLPPAPAI